MRRRQRGALVAGGLLVSPCIREPATHRADPARWPGAEARVGGGLSSSIGAPLSLEFLLRAHGVLVYRSAVPARNLVGW